jgi:hypothetical protein
MTKGNAVEARATRPRKGRQARHKVWLHIGMPKTGTTTLQNVMFSNRKLLRRYGYFYPDFGDKQHVALVRELAKRAGSRIPFPEEGDCGPCERFKEVLEGQATRSHTSIISSEYFFQRPGCLPGHSAGPGQDPFELIRRTIQETADYFAGCEVNVLMWLRRQDNWLMSMYNQTVKSSLYTGEFASYAEHTVGAHLPQIVGLWIDRFGRDHVFCHSYDALSAGKLNIVDVFLDTVCGDIPRESFRKTDSSRNISLSNEALWLKKRINNLVREKAIAVDRSMQQRVRTLLHAVTNSSPDQRMQLLSKEQRKKLMGSYLKENELLVKEMGYPELQPLIELDDLEEPAAPVAEESVLILHAVDQMIQTLLFAEPEWEEGLRPARGRGVGAGAGG